MHCPGSSMDALPHPCINKLYHLTSLSYTCSQLELSRLSTSFRLYCTITSTFSSYYCDTVDKWCGALVVWLQDRHAMVMYSDGVKVKQSFTCPAREPVAPAAAVTTQVSPKCGFPCSCTPSNAVRPTIPVQLRGSVYHRFSIQSSFN